MDKNSKGMYCSRIFANWMIRKNERDTDYPAISYYKLIRLFCRTNYDEFYVEEERKGNQFYYDIEDHDDRIILHSSYELVFLPYGGRLTEVPYYQEGVDEPEPVDEFIPGYRILQTKGFMPGSTYRAFEGREYHTMKYIVEEIMGRAKLRNGSVTTEKYSAGEFQEAEETDFIDNEWPYSCGQQCPDKIICHQMYTNILIKLMKEADRLGLAGDKDDDLYELRLVSYIAAIISSVIEEGYKLSAGLSKSVLTKKSGYLFDEFYASVITDPVEICQKLRTGLMRDIEIVIDRTEGIYSDYDLYDNEEAPVGLTADDYYRIETIGHRSVSEDDVAEIDDSEDDFEDYLMDDYEDDEEDE